jgi:hypothetical protein
MINLAVALDSGDPGKKRLKTVRLLSSLKGTVRGTQSRCVPKGVGQLGRGRQPLVFIEQIWIDG